MPIPKESFYVDMFRGSATRATSRWTFTHEPSVDFDGDGTNDVMVPRPRRRGAESTCPFDVEWDLYVVRKRCGLFVGRVRGRPQRMDTSGPRRVLVTERSNVGPTRLPTTFRYELLAHGFEKKSEQQPSRPTRCQVHPKDCHTSRCRLAGHPDGAFDFRALDSELRRVDAAKTCRGKVRRATRCLAHYAFAPETGHATVISTEGCGAARGCVKRAFETMQVSPFSARRGPQTGAQSFQLTP